MRVGVPKEVKADEYRVSVMPVGAELLVKAGHQVFVEAQAGVGSGFSDEDYQKAGATIVTKPEEIFQNGELIIKVKEPLPAEIMLFRPGQMIFSYKVNTANSNAMQYGNAPFTNSPGSWDGVTPLTNWCENGNLGAVQSTKLTGTWILQFTSDTNITLIGADGSQTNLVIPPYFASNFAETNSFSLYLGAQPNTAPALNQAMVYSSFAVAGVPGAYSENFVGEPVLDTNSWNNSISAGPSGVLIVPPGAPYWINWTLPAAGYALTESGSLLPDAFWFNVSTYTPLPMAGFNSQLISTNDMVNPKGEFFRLIQRVATRLQVLLPGETNAPNTVSGYTGSPTPVSFGGGQYAQENVTVLLVDADWNPVPGGTDVIAITSSDANAISPNNAALVNGTVTFDSANPFLFVDQGSWTITATDTTTASITAGTSAAVTVGP